MDVLAAIDGAVNEFKAQPPIITEKGLVVQTVLYAAVVRHYLI